MIDEKKLEKLSKHKDEDVRELVAECQKMIETPYYSPLISLLVQRKSWEQQTQQNKIDLFNSESKPIFDVVYKYFGEMKPLLELEEYLKSKLTPQQQEKAKEAANAFERSLQRNGLLNED